MVANGISVVSMLTVEPLLYTNERQKGDKWRGTRGCVSVRTAVLDIFVVRTVYVWISATGCHTISQGTSLIRDLKTERIGASTHHSFIHLFVEKTSSCQCIPAGYRFRFLWKKRAVLLWKVRLKSSLLTFSVFSCVLYLFFQFEQHSSSLARHKQHPLFYPYLLLFLSTN